MNDVVKRKEQAVVTPPVTPMDMISKALTDKDFDVLKLEKMMQLQERWEDRQAEKAFAKAMAGFIAECPPIHRSKKADRFTYAPIEEIMETIRPYLEKHQLSVSFDSEFDREGYLTTFCHVLHIDGHMKSNKYVSPVDTDNKTKLNVMQIQGSVLSYGRRYALSAALGLVYVSEDNNAESVYQRINDDQVTVINDLLDETQADKTLFLKWCRSKSVEDIPASKYEACVDRLVEIREDVA